MNTHQKVRAYFAFLTAAFLLAFLPSQARADITISTGTTITVAADTGAPDRYNITTGTLTLDVASGATYTLDKVAAGPAAINVSAAGAVLIIQGSGTTVFVSNTRTGERGAAIAITNGTALMQNVSFGDVDNFALGNSSRGGGALFMNGGYLTLENGGFYGNTGNATSQHGGAIYIGGAAYASMTNVVFEGNTHLSDGRVGGVAFVNAGTLALTNARFGALGDSTRANKSHRGGAIFMNGGRLDITGGEFYGNMATSSTGGAVYYAAPVTGSLTNVVFAENSAALDGGALVLLTTAVIPVTSATFGIEGDATSGNKAGVHGGAIWHGGSGQLTITNAGFYHNESGTSGASGRGGAIYNTGAATSGVLTNVAFKNNAATGWGGAIFWSGSSLRIQNALFEENRASDNHGGAIFFNNSSLGGLIQSATFAGNSSSSNAGAVYVYGNLATVNHVTMTDVLFSGNHASNGGALFMNGANAVVTLNDALFTSNTASGTSGMGGALVVQGGTVNLNLTADASYTDNNATSGGGFLYLNSGGAFNINVADTATLTIGGADATKDTISSGTFTDTVISINSTAGNNGSVILASDNSAYLGHVSVAVGRLLLGGADAKLGGVITAASGVTFGGQGSFNNATIASGGTLQVGLDGASGYPTQALSTTGTLVLAADTTITGDGILGGAGEILIGSAAGDTVSVATDETQWIHINNAIQGAGGIVKTGAGVLGLAGANTFSGGVALDSGTLRLGSSSALGTGTLTVTGTGATVGFIFSVGTIANNIVLNETTVFDTLANSARMTGTISGPGGFVKEGSGWLNLAGATLSIPSIDINGGSLGGDINGVSSISISNTAAYVGNLTRSSGQTLSITTGSIGGNLSLSQGSLFEFDLASASSGASLTIGGTLAATGTTTLNFLNLGNATYTIISAGTVTVDASNFIYNVNGGALTGRNSLAVNYGETDITVAASYRNLRMTWTGTSGAIWDTAAQNWSDATTSNYGEKLFVAGDSILFGSAASGTVVVAPAGVTAGDIEVDASGALAFAGGAITTDALSASVDGDAGSVSLGASGTVAATGRLVKKGTGTLTFANDANIFAGGLEIAAGVVSFSKAAQLGTTGTNITFAGAGTLRADGDVLASGAGALANSIAIDGVTATIDTQGYTVDYTGTLSATAGAALAKTGTGSLVLRTVDNSTFTAPTTVNAGKLLLSDGAKLGGALTIASGALGGGAGTFGGTVTVNNGALQVGGGGESGASAGALNIAGALTLTGTSQVNFGIYGGSLTDMLNVTGTVTADNANSIVSLSFGVLGSGSYNLGNAVALAAVQNIEVNGIAVDSSLRAVNELVASGGSLFFVYGADDARYMDWTGASGTSTWNIGLANWQGYNGDDSGKTKFLDGDTVRFATAGDTTVGISADVTVSDMIANNTGTLAFTGQGIATGLAVTGTLVKNPDGKLVKQGEGVLIFDNTANTFIGGIEINGGVLAFGNVAQISTAGAGIKFTGSGTLRATAAGITLSDTITLANAAAAFDTGANSVTLTGGLAGSGTLVKLGSGELTYSGAISGSALLGADTATRIDEGYVLLRDFTTADAAALTHTFELNGGWLDLSDAAGFNLANPDASVGTNYWENLTITGTLGGVISSNDSITLRAGDIIGGIGDPSVSAKQGVYVAIDAPSGVVTMDGANHYAGYTVIKAGTLRVSANDQLGLESLNREVRIGGASAVLEITQNGFASARSLTLNENGAVSVVASATATWSGSITGDSKTLSKTGEGTLVVTGTANTASLVYHVAAGALEGNAASLPNAITTAAVGTVVLNQSTDADYSPRITGEGSFEKRGTGVLTITGAFAHTGATRILDGTLKLSASNLLQPVSAHAIGVGAALDMRGTTQTIDSLANDGSLLMAASVNSNEGVVITSDYLKVTQSLTGAGNITVNLTEIDSSIITGSTSVVLIAAGDNQSDFTIDIVGGASDAIFGWDVTKDGGNYNLEQKRLVPIIPAVAGVDALIMIASETVFDSLSRQLTALRLCDEGELREGYDFWMNAVYRHDIINETIYDGAEANTQGIQAGLHFFKGSRSYAAGIFADFTKSDLDMHQAGTRAKTSGGGVYLTIQPNSLFHIDAVARVSTGRHTLTVAGVPSFNIGTTGVGASLGMGYTIKTKSGWNVEPQAQIIWSSTKVDDTTDSAHRKFQISDVVSFRERVGVQFSKLYMPNYTWAIRPHFRMAYNHEFKGENDLTVLRYYDADRTAYRDRYDYTDDFSGGSFNLGGGVAVRYNDRFDLWVDAAANLGGKIESYGINFGIAMHW